MDIHHSDEKTLSGPKKGTTGGGANWSLKGRILFTLPLVVPFAGSDGILLPLRWTSMHLLRCTTLQGSLSDDFYTFSQYFEVCLCPAPPKPQARQPRRVNDMHTIANKIVAGRCSKNVPGECTVTDICTYIALSAKKFTSGESLSEPQLIPRCQRSLRVRELVLTCCYS